MFIFLFAVCVTLWIGFIIYHDKSSNHLKPLSFDIIIKLGFIYLLLTIGGSFYFKYLAF